MDNDTLARSATRILLLSLGLSLVIFLVDVVVPNGVGIAVTYVVVVLATLWSSQRRVTLTVTAVATALTVLGALVDRDPTPAAVVVANRALAIGTIWVTAFVVLKRQRADTALRSHQQRLAAILETVQAAFVGMDGAGLITDWNPQAELLFGWSRPEVIGQVLAETIIPPEQRDEYERALQPSLATGEGPLWHKRVELTGLHRDGRRFPVELLLGASKRPQGEAFFYAFFQDITERKQMEHELREGHRVMQSLAGRLITSHEDERRRLARHLHDDLSQRLALWSMELELAAKEPLENLWARLGRFRELTAQLAEEVRKISHRLHPAMLEQLGLIEAVQHECERFAEVEGIDVRFTSSNMPAPIPMEIALPLYRVVQEALRNIAKHAKAKQAQVRLHCEADELQLSIQDDGIGFTVGHKKQSQLGLLSMEERVRLVEGHLAIESRPGQGTRIEVIVPLPASVSCEA